jgi:N-acetylmuramoyl-L-alanine amidase
MPATRFAVNASRRISAPRRASLLGALFLIILLARPGTAAIVCVDPGHGHLPGDGQSGDPGARGVLCVRESEVNLEVALFIQAQSYNERCFDIVLTRDNEEYVTLQHRLDKAEALGATVFMSVHHDAFSGTTPRTCEGNTVGINTTTQGTETLRSTIQNNDPPYYWRDCFVSA